MAQKHRRLIPIISWTALFTLGTLFWILAIKYGYSHILSPIYSYLSTHVPIEWVIAAIIVLVILLDPLRRIRKR